MEQEFEERCDVKHVYSKLFYSLWRDNKISNKYYSTIDYNFVDSFYADNDEEAIEYFIEKRWK